MYTVHYPFTFHMNHTVYNESKSVWKVKMKSATPSINKKEEEVLPRFSN